MYKSGLDDSDGVSQSRRRSDLCCEGEHPHSTDVVGLIFDRFLRSGSPTPLISLAVVTRSFISWLSSPASPIWPDCSELSTMSVPTSFERPQTLWTIE